jgi:hypothetical protein
LQRLKHPTLGEESTPENRRLGIAPEGKDERGALVSGGSGEGSLRDDADLSVVSGLGLAYGSSW